MRLYSKILRKDLIISKKITTSLSRKYFWTMPVTSDVKVYLKEILNLNYSKFQYNHANIFREALLNMVEESNTVSKVGIDNFSSASKVWLAPYGDQLNFLECVKNKNCYAWDQSSQHNLPLQGQGNIFDNLDINNKPTRAILQYIGYDSDSDSYQLYYYLGSETSDIDPQLKNLPADCFVLSKTFNSSNTLLKKNSYAIRVPLDKSFDVVKNICGFEFFWVPSMDNFSNFFWTPNYDNVFDIKCDKKFYREKALHQSLQNEHNTEYRPEHVNLSRRTYYPNNSPTPDNIVIDEVAISYLVAEFSSE